MSHIQRIAVERRSYNQWAANETLEDFALRFTANRVRLKPARVAQTALGALAFLACEALGGSLTLGYGTLNALVAIAALMVLAFAIGLPIAIQAAKSGLDIDLLTRAAGFGYIGSTVTSLVYASFTFVLFSIEASIMSVALSMVLGLPLWLAHMISALVVIPIAAFGIKRISSLQLATQPVWIVLQVAPLLIVALMGSDRLPGWLSHSGTIGSGGFDPLLIGAGLSLLMSLLPQIGEQVDYLRFMSVKRGRGWWVALVLAGPGWVFIAGAKLVLGSFLAYLALSQGLAPERAAQPAEIYNMAFAQLLGNPTVALVLTGVFVCVCQVKINVTNAYSGSIAWSNFFSRLTHNHPGRVVWLVFNCLLALMLMEFGVFRAIESILDLYSMLAVGWLGAIAGDLVIAKPLKLSPPVLEFKRAHLYDINPVGCGAMAFSVLVAVLCFLGLFGEIAQAYCVVIGLVISFFTAPLIAWGTGGRFYLARESQVAPGADGLCQCGICENRFDPVDMAQCPAYGVPICSLCCSLEGRCRDLCKTDARASQQAARLADRLLTPRIAARTRSRIGQVAGLTLLFALTIAGLYGAVLHQMAPGYSLAQEQAVTGALWVSFLALLILSGLTAWFLVLAHESRRKVEDEFQRQAEQLMEEATAREKAEAAAQKARAAAESANIAKSRFLTGLSHEVRTPLNSIYGYAQLMERDGTGPKNAVNVIRRSAEHLTDLVDALQDISRIESGTMVLSRDRIALPELLEQLADMFRLQAEQKGIAFAYARTGRLPRQVLADRKRFRQVLINLLTNAVKFTEAGRVGMRVQYRDPMLVVEVHDTGIGIAPQDQERIFQPFDRGSGARAQAIPGSGLGLTITKLLVEIMGGRIRVESTPGQGSTMTVEMLMFEAEPGAEAPAKDLPVTGYSGPRRRVLLVDNDPQHLELTRQVLEPLGFALTLATGGAEALEKVTEAPDLALLDIAMPGMDGWELAHHLRARFPGIAILMVSGNAQDARASAPRDGGADHDAFLAKPFEVKAMEEIVGELLHLTWLRDKAAPPPPVAVRTAIDTTALRAAAEIGHRRGVLNELDRLAGTGVDPARLAAWRALAEGFDLPGLLARLKEETDD
ncbi:response regulator [Pseudooceanicola sp. CBS1P-1]|uniref:histidine kinase n=1 Tax=Pseudooceanicola albus TaxID=2692189 RepID=A0A6L7FZW3_9RHOB|nr:MULTISPECIES: ATP-binding protein [Pseudooceanicola]MBT9382431.1 response regulator [Pseudooceanicola endophyticus]MXN16972.1 response regulator [Pseudooceanicola albus]